jgi:hypothetical protein
MVTLQRMISHHRPARYKVRRAQYSRSLLLAVIFSPLLPCSSLSIPTLAVLAGR